MLVGMYERGSHDPVPVESCVVLDPILDRVRASIASWLEGDGVDTSKLPRVIEHRRRMLARPAVQKAVAVEGTQIH